MDPRLVTPYLIAAFIVWALYRRMRRSFGRQRIRGRLMWTRVGVLTLIALFAAIAVARDAEVLAGLVAGIACGAALGWFGLSHTRFEVTSSGRYYTPHAYLGIAVTTLFVARLLYRFLYVYHGALPTSTAGEGLATAYQRSPLTLALLGVLVGYYVLYYAGILQRARTLTPPAPAASADLPGK